MPHRLAIALGLLLAFRAPLHAGPPVASYVFPAGAQRGQTVKVRVGGLFLHNACNWELLGPGVSASKQLKRAPTLWFEGPLLPLPDSQRQEDYPQDMEGEVTVRADATPGLRRARLWTSEGASSGLGFMVGELPEIVENEVDGPPRAVDVKLPVTINGRIFPRENVDAWAVALRKGQTISAEVHAARLGSPLDSRLEVRGPDGRLLAENDDRFGTDSLLHFTAPADGKYQVRIHDTDRRGGPNYVYRLTLTAGPYVERAFPLGARRGTKGRFHLSGPGTPREPVEVALPATAGAHLQRFPIGADRSNAVLLDLDDLPEHLNAEPKGPAEASLVTAPAMLNGRIATPGDGDCWKFGARRGEVLVLDLRARSLGSPLLGVLEVSDAAGKVVARAEAAGTQLDPTLTFTAPAEGTYCVAVRDRFRTRGGPAFAYRLRLAPPAPGFRLHFAQDALTLPRLADQPKNAKAKKPAPRGQVRLRVTAQREGGFNGAIRLTIEGLPKGVEVAPLILAPGQAAVDLTFTAAPDAPIRAVRVTIRGTALVAGREVAQTATLPAAPGVAATDSALLAVALVAPFKVVGSYDLRLAPRGSRFRKKYKIDRGGFTGPLEVRLADRQARHLQGVTGPVLTVPAGASELEYPVDLPPWMETGRTSRACIMLVGTIKEGGVEHVVSATSTEQKDQMIAVVETGRLGLEAGATSLSAKPGASVRLAVTVRRSKGLVGPVKVELVQSGHVRGLRAEPIVVPADRSEGSLTLRFGPGPLGPFNAPLIVRATLVEASGPVVAEVKVEVVADE